MYFAIPVVVKIVLTEETQSSFPEKKFFENLRWTSNFENVPLQSLPFYNGYKRNVRR